MSDMAKNLILWLVIAVVLMSVFQSFSPGEPSGRQMDYTTFVQEVGQGQVREVRMDGKTVNGVKRNGERFTTILPAQDPQLLNDLLNNKVQVIGEKPEEPSLLTSIFISWFPMLLLIGVLLALGATGIPMARFAVFAGALGVGLGFGLQAIFNNFVFHSSF